MDCPKCRKDTTVLVTTQNRKKVRERRGIVTIIISAPFRAVRFVWRTLFGRKEKYNEAQHWHCNYCGHDFKDKSEKD